MGSVMEFVYYCVTVMDPIAAMGGAHTLGWYLNYYQNDEGIFHNIYLKVDIL